MVVVVFQTTENKAEIVQLDFEFFLHSTFFLLAVDLAAGNFFWVSSFKNIFTRKKFGNNGEVMEEIEAF